VSTPRATATVGAWGLRVVTDEDKNWWIWNDFFPFFLLLVSVVSLIFTYKTNKKTIHPAEWRKRGWSWVIKVESSVDH
jgi:hypothetical protein